MQERDATCPQCGRNVDLQARGQAARGGRSAPGTIPKWKRKHAETTREVVPRRECPVCGTTVVSRVLLQCPICKGVLPEIPEEFTRDEKLVFTDGKLKRKSDIEVLASRWRYKEGLGVFMNCLIAFLVARFLVFALMMFQMDEPTAVIPTTITSVILNAIPGILMGIVPVLYVVGQKHQFTKLGVRDDNYALDLALGVAVGVGMFFLYGVGAGINEALAGLGWRAFAAPTGDLTGLLLAESWEKVVLTIVLVFSAVGEEIAFRGVLTNALRARVAGTAKRKRANVRPQGAQDSTSGTRKKTGTGKTGRPTSRKEALELPAALLLSFLVALAYAGLYSLFLLSATIFVPALLVNLFLTLIFLLREGSLNLALTAQVIFTLLNTLSILGLLGWL